MKRTIVAIGLALVMAPLLSAEAPDVTSWFRTAPMAGPYAGVQSDVVQVFSKAEDAGLPLDPLMDRLQQGAAKGVSGDVLVGALRVESGRLSEGRDILQRQGVFFPAQGDRNSTLRTISFSLTAGLSARAVESVFTAARKAGRSPWEATSAIEALAQTELSHPLTDAQIQRLGSALMKSRMLSAAFPSVDTFLTKASVPGLSDEEAVDRAISKVLDSEGGPIESDDGPQATQPGKVSNGQSPASSHSPGEGRPAVTGRPASAGQPALGGRPADPGVAGQGHRQAR